MGSLDHSCGSYLWTTTNSRVHVPKFYVQRSDPGPWSGLVLRSDPDPWPGIVQHSVPDPFHVPDSASIDPPIQGESRIDPFLRSNWHFFCKENRLKTQGFCQIGIR